MYQGERRAVRFFCSKLHRFSASEGTARRVCLARQLGKRALKAETLLKIICPRRGSREDKDNQKALCDEIVQSK